jgi:prepilin-type N-terminal cleavage/methylation domain-containing protein
MPCANRKIRFGFTMIEIMAALSLLVIFFAASGEIFKSTVLLGSASQNLCDRASQIDSALHPLRTDVWNCRSMRVVDPRFIKLSLADGGNISWKIDSQNCVVRTDAAGHAERWDAIGAGWSFSTDNVSLSLSDGTPIPMRMISQILLAQSEQP